MRDIMVRLFHDLPSAYKGIHVGFWLMGRKWSYYFSDGAVSREGKLHVKEHGK